MGKNKFWQQLISVKYVTAVICLSVAGYLVGSNAAIFLPTPTQALDRAFFACMDTTSMLTAIGCVHAHAPAWIATYGAARTAQELDRYEARAGSDFTCHLAGHELGQAVLHADSNNIGEALGQCTNSCFSSCLHGVVIGYMASSSVKQLLALHPEQLCAAPDVDNYPLCLHGLGHAFLIGEKYNLSAALKDCDSLQLLDPSEAQCYSGVYMELFFAADGLAHGEVASSTYSKPGDPFYPCDVAPTITKDRYARQCFIQVNALLETYADAHNESVFTLCQSAPSQWQDACVIGIGLKQTGANSDIRTIINACAKAPDLRTERECLSGAYGFLAAGGTPGEVRAFCAAVQDKNICNPSPADSATLNEIPPMALP